MGRVSTAFLLLVFGVLCNQARAADSPADVAFFESRIRPLLAQRCFRCHSEKEKKTRGGLALDSKDRLLKGGENGAAVLPGNPSQSLLVRALQHQDRSLAMPPSGKLADAEIALLVEWVRRGAPFPAGRNSPSETSGDFWSFLPLKEHPVPMVRRKDWPRKRIDSFILAGLEKNGLQPAGQAPPRVLLRRIHFDLIGLPPTPEEMDAFEKDSSPDAYEKVVERLLASPHHGERWARHWLDLARYCDVPESWAPTKGKPHLYRDWVVRALNDDVPYDRFVRLQLAADLVPDAAPKDRAALGFLGLSPTYWKELKLAPDVIRTVVAEEWEERIHTLGSTFLGLTIGCARCHDHKFDPISMKDYYRLAGVFASIRQADLSLLPQAEASKVDRARKEAATLEARRKKLEKSKVDKDRQEAAMLAKRIEMLRRDTPHFDDPQVPGVVEASLFVEPDGTQRTKLTYKIGQPRSVAMHLRGNPATPGSVVPRGFLSLFSGNEPPHFAKGSGRLELAQALVSDAAPLTARVIVNRVWQHHFGRGLVATPSDFGTQGERPTHPELLDDLARRFVAGGWSLRWLHREIVLSATYRQASITRVKHQEIDPENRLLGRMNRRRLEVEAWRDAMLAVSGVLDAKVGGPAEDLGNPKNTRRTLYGTVKRRELQDLLRLHDFPDPVTHAGERVPTITPLQQLFTLNGPLVRAQAEALARRLKREVPVPGDQRIRHAYVLLFHRTPSPVELDLGRDFLAMGSDAVWEQYCQVLLGSNEFLFVD